MSQRVPLRTRKSGKRLKLDFNVSLGIPFYLLVVVLIVTPILLMVLYSFNTARGADVFNIQFSFNNYVSFFTNMDFVRVLLRSLYTAAIATTITLLIAYPLALFIVKLKTMGRIIAMSLVTAPMWLNMFLRAHALRTVLTLINPNLDGTMFAIIVGIVYIYLPFMVLPIFTVLSKIDKSLYEGAADLGANGVKTVFKVILPLSLTGVISGIMMVFLPAATTIVIPHVLGGGQTNLNMIGFFIQTVVIQAGRFGFGAAIAIILGLIMMLFIFLIRKTDKYGGGLDEKES